MNITRSSVSLTIARTGKFIIGFLGITFFARELGASSLGSFFLFQALLGILGIPANLGTRLAIEKRISGESDPNEAFSTGVALKLGLLIIVIPVIIVFRDYINHYIGAELALLLALGLILREFSGTMVDVLKGELRVTEAAILEFGYATLWVLIGVFLVTFNYGVVGVIYGILISRTILFITGCLITDVTLERPSYSELKALTEYSKYSVLPEVNGRIHSWMDVLILGVFLTSAAVGAYEVAWRITGPVLIVGGAIGAAIFPQISSWDSHGETDSVENLVQNTITPSLIIVFPAIIGGILLSNDILLQFFGTEYEAASLVLIVLLLGLISRAVRQITGKTLMGLNRPDLVTRVAVIDIILNFVLNVILIWRFGIVGAAIGTTVSITVGTILQYRFVTDYISIQVPRKDLGWSLISALLMGIAIYLLKTQMTIDSISKLFVIVGAGAAIYGCTLIINNGYRKMIVNSVKQMIQ